ncbi:MAG TPA: extracellular solute-binding protein [Fimbriimonas sp.]
MRMTFALLGALALVGCGTSGGGSGSGMSAMNPTYAPTGEAKPKGSLEVVAFKGGYGIDFYEQAAKEFAAKNQGLDVKVDGNPRVWEQLKPKLVAGSPPDLMYPGWGMDHWALVEEGQLMELDKALDSPAYDGQGKWRDTFEESILKLGQKNGKQYVLPYFFNMQGWWYNPDTFAKNGWDVPKTYDELLALCEKIKAKGIAPITFQGKYPYYMIEGMLLPWTQSLGGKQAVDDMQNLVPGAWKSASVLQAAKMIDELRAKGYYQKGAVGLSHTESQTEFLNGKAALIPCGTWLYSEMQKVMPPEAKMQFMLPPAVKDGKGDPTAIQISIEPWMVPKDAKNASAAISFFKFLTSLPKAKEFVEQKATLMAIKGSDQANLPATLVEPAKAFRESKTVWSYIMRQWYPSLETEVENALTSMLNAEITPEQFCDRAEAAAEKVRKDDSIAKHKL